MAVNRAMLRDQIKDVLLQRIIEGQYEPGQRIVEIRVADEFNVSQAPVREALRELEMLRLVVSEPFRGARVRAVSPEEIAEAYPVRAALEELAAKLAAPRLADGSAGLGQEVAGMRAAAADQDLRAFVRHDVAFHRLFVEAGGNQTLIQLWEALHVDLRTRLTLIQRLEDLADVAESHLPILRALDAGDGDQAGRLVREHIEGFGRWFVERSAGSGGAALAGAGQRGGPHGGAGSGGAGSGGAALGRGGQRGGPHGRAGSGGTGHRGGDAGSGGAASGRAGGT